MLMQINQRLYLLSQLKLQGLDIQALHTLFTGLITFFAFSMCFSLFFYVLTTHVTVCASCHAEWKGYLLYLLIYLLNSPARHGPLL